MPDAAAICSNPSAACVLLLLLSLLRHMAAHSTCCSDQAHCHPCRRSVLDSPAGLDAALPPKGRNPVGL